MENLRFAARMNGLSGNAIREIFKLLAQPDIISFAGGNPAPESFPIDQVKEIMDEALTQHGRTVLQYGATEGYAPLRESILPYLASLGVQAQVQDTLIISGSQQGIDLLCKTFIDPGDVVLVERPTYLAVLHILKTYQAKVVCVETNDDGLDLDDLEQKIKTLNPKFLYLVPTFQNPTGRTLSMEKRKQIAEMTAKHSLIVVEDDPYRELRYQGTPLPALKSEDRCGNIVYLTSFSKIIGPGIRVGCAVADAPILRAMTLGKQATDVHTNLLGQAVVDGFLRKGYLQPHIKRICQGYRKQLQTMLDGFEHFPAQATHLKPEGGLFVWVQLPATVNATALLEQAVARKVAYVPGEHFFADGTGQNTLRLNFSYSTLEQIEQGMRVLGGLLTETVKTC